MELMLAVFFLFFFALAFLHSLRQKKVNKGSFFERLNIKHHFCKYNFSLNQKFEFFIESFDSTSIATITNRYDKKKTVYELGQNRVKNLNKKHS